MILVDTNVLLRAAQPIHRHFAPAVAAIKLCRQRGHIPCIVPQVVYEYWVVATRSTEENGLGMTIQAAGIDVARIVEQFHLLRDERAIFDRWQNLVVQNSVAGKTAHDARLVAAMQRHGVTHLLSFNDRHFRRFSSVHVIHPDDAASLQVV